MKCSGSVWKKHIPKSPVAKLFAALERGPTEPARLTQELIGRGVSHQRTVDALARHEGTLFAYEERKWSINMKHIKAIKTIEQFAEEAVRLRQNAEAAEAEFLLFLRTFELEREDLWKTAGIVSYDGFLQSLQLCNTARYRNFVAGAKIVEDARAIGADATVAAGAFKSPTEEAAREYVSRCEKFRVVHGTGPSEQHAKTWVKQLDQAEPKVVRQASRMAQLEAENQKLRSENRELQRKLTTANKELEKLRRAKTIKEAATQPAA